MMLTILSCTYYTSVYLLWWDNCYKILPTIFKLDRLPFYYELKSFFWFQVIFLPMSFLYIFQSYFPLFSVGYWFLFTAHFYIKLLMTLETCLKKYIREISLCYVSWKLFPRSNFAPILESTRILVIKNTE